MFVVTTTNVFFIQLSSSQALNLTAKGFVTAGEIYSLHSHLQSASRNYILSLSTFVYHDEKTETFEHVYKYCAPHYRRWGFTWKEKATITMQIYD